MSSCIIIILRPRKKFFLITLCYCHSLEHRNKGILGIPAGLNIILKARPIIFKLSELTVMKASLVDCLPVHRFFFL